MGPPAPPAPPAPPTPADYPGGSAGLVEPLPDEPAAVARLEAERALVVADYHAGLEAGLRAEGVELPSRATERREHLLALLGRTDADRALFLGDLAHAIGRPRYDERTELETLLEAVTERVPATVVKGNHDGEIEAFLADLDPWVADRVTVAPADGLRAGSVGVAHGHTWPAREVLEAKVVCVAHEHPTVRLEDDVGGHRIERVWLRGRLDPAPFREHAGENLTTDAELVVFPAYNDLVGGTWVNADQGFLSPFLPEGLADGDAYLLDGTRLGRYGAV